MEKKKMPEMKHVRKKGQLAFMQSATIQVAIVIIVVAMVAIVLDQFKTTLTSARGSTENLSTLARNITISALDANVTFSNFFSVIVIIVVFVVIIGLIFYVLGGRGRNSM